MAIRIYDLDRKHVIDTEFGKVLDQYRELMGEYEIPWNDSDWCFNKPVEVQCYEIMGNKYCVVSCGAGLQIYGVEHDGFSYIDTYNDELSAYVSILDEWRR